jgi:glycosyltransferase involved in cell wall biosynthesis
MEAFPAVVKKVPNARLIVAGANHHTKPGYWESIRESLGASSRVEFRGYVPEEAIPDLFRTTSCGSHALRFRDRVKWTRPSGVRVWSSHRLR